MIAVGVDTHKHQHLAVAVDALGQLLAEITITATLAGYHQLLAWLGGLEGEIRVEIASVGVRGPEPVCAYADDSRWARGSRKRNPIGTLAGATDPTAHKKAPPERGFFA